MALIEPDFASKVDQAWRGDLDLFQLFDYTSRLEAAGDHALAAVVYRTWLNRNHTPNDHLVLFNLGVACANEGDQGAAKEAYRQAISLAPGFLQPRLNLASMLADQGDLEAAIAEWRWVERNAVPGDAAQEPLRQMALARLAPQRPPVQPATRRNLQVELAFQVDDTLPEEAALEACRTLAREALAARAAEGLPSGIAEAAVAGEFAFQSPVDASFRPRVSAIVSVYRAERFVRGCLQDLVEQTLFQAGELEIVVVDSGSPEGEGPIIQSFQEAFPRQIQYLRTRERETIYRAWNRGAQAARGSYLSNANADDRHRPVGLERLAAALDAHPEIALAYGDDDVTTEENATYAAAPRAARFLWPEFDPVHLFEVCHVGPHPMWRKALHQKHGWFDPGLRSAGDYDFWLRLAAAGERFLHVPETIGLYLQSREGVELGNTLLSSAESFLARARNWPRSWGPLPGVRGNYLFPPDPAGKA